ncbi:MAG: hypothetical protein BWX84_00124 [Verrucomicrobia bacterium ADurb.Bin118]|nr:MAG: hypothetical protein BWX84_00124 [Verrucomicrobia bacterium ADurb.Bin118]
MGGVAPRQPTQHGKRGHVGGLVSGKRPARPGEELRRGQGERGNHGAMIGRPRVDAVAPVKFRGLHGGNAIVAAEIDEINPIKNALGFHDGFGRPSNPRFLVGKSGRELAVAGVQFAIRILKPGIHTSHGSGPGQIRVIQVRRGVEIAGQKTRIRSVQIRLHGLQQKAQSRQACLIFQFHHGGLGLPVFHGVRSVRIRGEVAVEEVKPLPGARFDGDPPRTPHPMRHDDGIPADDGATARRIHVKPQRVSDGLRGAGVAFLQSHQVRARTADGFDAIAQTIAAVDPDVEAHHLQFGKRRAIK